ncbi:C-terminal helicase domain-containing protein, partial [Nonomuraea sp. RK-328]|nr:C-terminal helicase domain-containing protein [Nonomuraea sp. RK-328]
MVSEQLDTRGFAVAAVHGDLGQGQREQALRAFRNGKIDVLVATDVAARGIDIDDVTHVVNYDAPTDDKTYVHRIGRTGRAGRTGIAVTFVEWEELTRWKMINQMLGLEFAEPEETYSTSPHVYSELSIPEGTKGVLPHANRSRAGLSAERLEDLGETGRSRARGRRRDEREERPERTPRQRRRTRGGKLAEDTPVETPEVELVDNRSRKADEAPAIISADEVEAVAAEPRRRTRRTAAQPAADVTQPADTGAREVTDRDVRDRKANDRDVRDREVREVHDREVRDVRDREVRETEPVAERAPEPSFLSTPPPPVRKEPERIIPPNPFTVIFQSPDLATDDDDIAPSAATERKQQRRQSRGGGGGGGGSRRRAG